MPHRENRCRERGLRGSSEVLRRQRRSQRRVLHADLDRGCTRSLIRAATHAPREVAEQVAQQVMADNHGNNEGARRQNLINRTRHDDNQHVADTQDRNPRKNWQDSFHNLVRKQTHDKATQDRSEHHQQNVLRHRLTIHGHTRTDQPLGEHRGHQGREQRRD